MRQKLRMVKRPFRSRPKQCARAFFFINQKNCPVSETGKKLLVLLWFFFVSLSSGGWIETGQKKSETDQKFPETEQIFFGQPKKGRNRLDNWSTKRLTKTTWTGLVSDLFGPPSFFLVYQNFFLVYQKIRAWPKKIKRLTKNSLRLNKFFLVDQKKWDIDRTIGQPRDWPKPHGRDLIDIFIFEA